MSAAHSRARLEKKMFTKLKAERKRKKWLAYKLAQLNNDKLLTRGK